jgi:hypothetical protein
MRKSIIRHYEKPDPFDFLSASKVLLSTLEDIFKREQGDSNWPFGGGPITPDEIKEMVKDCNAHYESAGLDQVDICKLTYGRISNNE